uniref:Uncharacterized protein n=1 Tax=Setaria italica TaxID=4555 RepID=K3Y4B3_SETIT
MLPLHSGGLDNSEMFNLPGRERKKNLGTQKDPSSS